MNFFPICVDIADKKALIIGGGNTAKHKLKTILKYTNKITLIAEEIDKEILKLNIEVKKKSYEAKDLKDHFLIYACTNNKEINSRIFNDSKDIKAIVNVCDQPEMSDFISPAIYKINEMSVAVSSNAKNVKKSVSLRNKIMEFLKNDPFKG